MAVLQCDRGTQLSPEHPDTRCGHATVPPRDEPGASRIHAVLMIWCHLGTRPSPEHPAYDCNHATVSPRGPREPTSSPHTPPHCPVWGHRAGWDPQGRAWPCPGRGSRVPPDLVTQRYLLSAARAKISRGWRGARKGPPGTAAPAGPPEAPGEPCGGGDPLGESMGTSGGVSRQPGTGCGGGIGTAGWGQSCPRLAAGSPWDSRAGPDRGTASPRLRDGTARPPPPRAGTRVRVRGGDSG